VLRHYDCIVVGLGPAGSTALKDISTAGVRALGVDKAAFPRDKCCGGALSAAAERQLQVPEWKQAVEAEMHTVRVALRLGQEMTHSTPEPICRFVMRDQFDHVLVEAAIASGAEVLCGEPIVSLEIAPPGVIVQTPTQKLTARCLVGCDGAHSVVARSLGLSPAASGAAIEQEMVVPNKVVRQWEGTVYVSYGDPAWGYGWVFPKKHGLSVGVGSFSPRKAQLPLHLERLLAHCKLSGYPSRRSGHPIPLGGMRRQLHKGPVCLAGDAASLCDPLSGEGISHALLSGHIAARHVLQYLTGETRDFAAYQAEIEQRITQEMALARWIAGKLYRAPRLFFGLLQRSPSTLALYFQLIGGTATYRDVVNHLKQQFRRFAVFGTG
jgi:geranylgeranyl reductase family protein